MLEADGAGGRPLLRALRAVMAKAGRFLPRAYAQASESKSPPAEMAKGLAEISGVPRHAAFARA